MAKKTWVNGSWLTPAEMNAYWGTDATTGHIHDGADSDASLPQVNLTTHVTGELPSSSLGDYTSGSFSVDSRYLDSTVTKTWQYQILNGQCSIFAEDMLGTSAVHSNLEFLATGGTWPSDIIPNVARKATAVMRAEGAGDATVKVGDIGISALSSSAWLCRLPDEMSNLGLNNFGTGGGNFKGLEQQMLQYWLV
jgi:hypothetical protein